MVVVGFDSSELLRSTHCRQRRANPHNLHPSEPELEPETSSAWSWEDSPSWRGGFARDVVPGAAQKAKAEIAEKVAPQETPQFGAATNSYENQSRLNSLRGVFFPLGLKNLSKSRGTAPADDGIPLPQQSKPGHSVFARRFPPFAQPGPVFATRLKPRLQPRPKPQ